MLGLGSLSAGDTVPLGHDQAASAGTSPAGARLEGDQQPHLFELPDGFVNVPSRAADQLGDGGDGRPGDAGAVVGEFQECQQGLELAMRQRADQAGVKQGLVQVEKDVAGRVLRCGGQNRCLHITRRAARPARLARNSAQRKSGVYAVGV